MSGLAKASKIDLVNVGLLLFSCALAFVIPFELFLFVYAFLGPLHYLTEISWLHDKNYYSKSKKDVILLVIISLFLTFLYIGSKHFPEVVNDTFGEDRGKMISYLTFIGFGSALFMALIKKPIIRIIGIICLFLLMAVSDYFIVFFTMFLPTLVHVFLFTSLFMLYGALKSKSKVGLLTVVLHLICPLLLIFLLPGKTFFEPTSFGQSYAESDFVGLNQYIISRFDLTQFEGMTFTEILYQSEVGVATMRFIAFAYTYHYLNWFSKTEIIRWHKVPKSRFAVVIIGWVVSIVIYAYDYALGLQWLFLLSFMHVLLEFPLNYVSFLGIFQELRSRVVKTT